MAYAMTDPSALPSFATISDAAKYLKRHPIGTACILTGDSATRKGLHGLFAQRGVFVSRTEVSGNPPCRMITLTTVGDWRVQQLPTRISARSGGLRVPFWLLNTYWETKVKARFELSNETYTRCGLRKNASLGWSSSIRSFQYANL